MKEVKTPKKPLLYYYTIVLIVLFLFNLIAMPMLSQFSIEEVGYSDFVNLTEEKKIDEVKVETNQILFTVKDEKDKVYKTGIMDDPELIDRLTASGATFGSEIVRETSPIVSLLLSWILPMLIFMFLGQRLMKKMTDKEGGPNSMMFGMGKSNAKIYVSSTEGIKFADVAGEDEAKESLAEIVDYLHNPGKYRDIGASMPKGILLV